jgi:RimJ/RimL family protein N-acetyltransferase
VELRLEVPILTGTLVRLEPLSADHAADLGDAADADRGTYAYARVPRAGDVDRYVAAALSRVESEPFFPFAQIRLSDGRAVGCTAFGNARTWPGIPGLSSVEIGWTWLGSSAQRSGINRDAKLLLMTHAFETWGVARVEIKTDARNTRSREAIARLGATFEGVLRRSTPSHALGEEGLLRDSAMYSVTSDEWPSVRSSLLDRLGRGAT